jgi:hypothetical protein
MGIYRPFNSQQSLPISPNFSMMELKGRAQPNHSKLMKNTNFNTKIITKSYLPMLASLFSTTKH